MGCVLLSKEKVVTVSRLCFFFQKSFNKVCVNLRFARLPCKHSGFKHVRVPFGPFAVCRQSGTRVEGVKKL